MKKNTKHLIKLRKLVAARNELNRKIIEQIDKMHFCPECGTWTIVGTLKKEKPIDIVLFEENQKKLRDHYEKLSEDK